MGSKPRTFTRNPQSTFQSYRSRQVNIKHGALALALNRIKLSNSNTNVNNENWQSSLSFPCVDTVKHSYNLHYNFMILMQYYHVINEEV